MALVYAENLSTALFEPPPAKKITFALIVCFIIVSCGKKGDPVFKESKRIYKIQSVVTNKV